MDLLDLLLGRSKRSSGGQGGLFDLIGDVSKWVIGCGCALILLIVGGIALLIAGVVHLGDTAIMVIVVVVAVVVAVASLIRNSLMER